LAAQPKTKRRFRGVFPSQESRRDAPAFPRRALTARLRERGFNQSLEISRGIAKTLGLPPAPALLERIRNTPSQRTLKRAGRMANLKDAFLSRPEARGKHILLIDDVMTTGSTLRIAADTLLNAGAASVSVAVLARD
ncbi:MAG: ComF family protein, partial [Deltaproteobacteria bacterium]|nr:ComF family protein [Deltaproteobacteria bacterium]